MTHKNPAGHTISTTPLRCLECGRLWVGETERWRVYLSDDEPRQPLTYCSDCAQREFD